MNFCFINWINLSAVAYLIFINMIVAKKGIADSFSSQHLIVNIFEQIGRYSCMALMILPIFTKDWKFEFQSKIEMILWASFTILLLLIYSFLWLKKPGGGVGILYGLALVPVVLFLLNGILLRHLALMIASLIFGVFHFITVKENT